MNLRSSGARDKLFEPELGRAERTLIRGVYGSGGPSNLQSAISYCGNAKKNLLGGDDVNNLLDTDPRNIIELGEERKVLIEEGHCEERLLACELFFVHLDGMRRGLEERLSRRKKQSDLILVAWMVGVLCQATN